MASVFLPKLFWTEYGFIWQPWYGAHLRYYANTAQKCPLGMSSVNVTKPAGNCGFSHIYWRNP